VGGRTPREVAVNWDIAAARRYHEETKHTFESVRRGARFLDWDNRPHPFKDYEDLEPNALPDALELSWLLRWGAGVIRTRELGPETYHFRTYSSAGALYPVEVYVAGPDTNGLDAGLYHFHPLESSLRRLRANDVRGVLGAAAADESLAAAEAVFVLTGILWRTAWKYEARGYRHLYWDAGTMLANFLELATCVGDDIHIVTGFVDDALNRVVGVDGEREAAVALMGLGHASPTPPGDDQPALALRSRPLSQGEVEYPDAHALHAASRLETPDDVRQYRGDWQPPRPTSSLGVSRADLERILRRRGSVREFRLEPVLAADLAAILAYAAGDIPLDVPPCAEIYFIANAVDGLAPGAYRFMAPATFELLREGNFRREAGYLALGQALGAYAAATIFFLADLDAALEAHGNRAYRALQLEGGIRGGRVYLGAYARGLGATASTFYDDDVTAFFAPGSTKIPLLCAAVGRRP
jgi:SagB-type dehydrogenase family enzyme